MKRNMPPVEGWEKSFLPSILVPPWHKDMDGEDGARYRYGSTTFTAIVSAGREPDGKRWLHVSAARQERLPSWDELRMVKDLFIGVDRYAYIVIPKKSKHVNINPNCLHLWACLDGEPMPDFTHGGSSL